jgi:Nif-specific regulatory protein
VASGAQGNGIIGTCRVLRDLLGQVERVARTKLPVLILGASGTGKELVARYIHDQSPRASGPFVEVHCGAIAESLAESTLFGFEKGMFTGAVAAKAGKFEEAHGGTIFLDEFGELSPSLQVKLLRALQEKVVERIGGKPRKIDVRIVAATNRDLQAMMAKGTFREDLYYRVSGLEVTLPPLRERGSDIALLAEEMLQRATAEHGLPPMRFSDDALQALLGHSWPGNVRELQRVVERTAALADGDEISAAKICWGSGRCVATIPETPSVGAMPPSVNAAALQPTSTGPEPLAARRGRPRAELERIEHVVHELLSRKDWFKRAEFDATFGASKSGSQRALLYLAEQGIVQPRGSGPATVYVRGERWAASDGKQSAA